MKREKRLFKNTVILSLGAFLPKLTALIVLPILTDCLTKTEYGTYDLVNTLVALAIPLVSLKLENATFRFLIDCRDDKNRSAGIISSSLAAVIGISSALFVVSFLMLRKAGYAYSVCILIGIYFFLNTLFTMLSQIARGLGRNLIYSFAVCINAFVSMIMIIWLVKSSHMGLNGLLMAMNVSLVIGIFYFVFSIRIFGYLSFSLISTIELKKMFSYSLPLIPNSLSLWMMEFSDRFIVTAFLGIEMNAVYAIANKIPGLFHTLQNTFISAWQENASESIKDEDSDEYYSYMFDIVFTLMIGILACLIAVTPLLFRLLINAKYIQAYYQMPFLFGGMVCFSLSSFLGGIYAAHRKTKTIGYTTIAAAIMNLLLDLGLIKQIGLYAASISTFLSCLFLVIFRMMDVRKFQLMKYNIKKIVVYSFIMVIMGILLFINNPYVNVFVFVFGIAFGAIINRTLLQIIFRSIVRRLQESE